MVPHVAASAEQLLDSYLNIDEFTHTRCLTVSVKLAVTSSETCVFLSRVSRAWERALRLHFLTPRRAERLRACGRSGFVSVNSHYYLSPSVKLEGFGVCLCFLRRM